jgi:hypothetical protein
VSAEEKLLYREEQLKAWEEGQRPLPRQALIGVAVNDAVRLSLANGNAYVVFDKDFNPSLAK